MRGVASAGVGAGAGAACESSSPTGLLAYMKKGRRERKGLDSNEKSSFMLFFIESRIIKLISIGESDAVPHGLHL